jgi:hypothetical protein
MPTTVDGRWGGRDPDRPVDRRHARSGSRSWPPPGRERPLQFGTGMKLSALIPLALLGCGLPPPPAAGSAGGELPDASVSLPPPDDTEDEPDVDAGPRPDAQPRDRVLTQTTSEVVEPNGSIVCADKQDIHFDNSWYRVFDLATVGIASGFHVTRVEVGVERAQSGNGAGQPVEVELHAVTGDIQNGDLTTLATTSQTVADTLVSRVEFPIDAMVPAGTKLAVEVRVPDGENGGHRFVIGANSLGQTAPGYIRAPVCGDEGPTSLNEIDADDVHLLIDVAGE